MTDGPVPWHKPGTTMERQRARTEAVRRLVAFRLGDGRFAVDVRAVLGVLQPDAVVRALPGAAPWVCGMTEFRGRLVPMVDVAHWLGMEPCSPAGHGRRWLLVAAGEAWTGLVVDDVTGVCAVSPSDAREVPPSGGGMPRVCGAWIQEGSVMMELDLVVLTEALAMDDPTRSGP